jgi:hypothetical protein
VRFRTAFIHLPETLAFHPSTILWERDQG